MELRDLVVTPVILAFIYAAAYIIRPRVTDQITRRYFFPALTLRIMGALAVGFVYQFYYSGGDTFNYHTHGSRVIWDAFMDSPSVGLNLFANKVDFTGGYKYISQIYFYSDPSSFTVIQLATLFDILTFSSYSGTAVLFAVISFIGSWVMFSPFYKMYPHLHKWLAIAIFYIPSVLFWGSGLLKDTITYSCVGFMVYTCYYLFIEKEFKIRNYILLLGAVVILYKIKIYILLTFLPAMILWVFFVNLSKIKNKVARGFAAPLFISIAVGLAVFAALKAGEDNPKYAFNKLAETARVTAYDIRYWTGKGAGSGYTLGELDGTFNSMITLAPSAVVVSLFRPYLWEVNNPLMLMSAIESFLFLFLLLVVLARSNFLLLKAMSNSTVVFCLVFSLIFAFAVGVSTFNFGTLVRYKIPMMPFFIIALLLIDDLSRQERIKRLLH